MPQYPVGDRKRVVELGERLADHDGLFLCGGGIDSIGLPDCIRSGERASEMAYEYLERSQRSTAAEYGAPLSRQLLE